jgi:hypothetical protein
MNLDCNNHVVVYYPHGAGGKFLMNCLALSGQAVLQDEKLAKLDLDGNLNLKDKFNLLMHRLSQETAEKGKWTDLGLGDIQLFGIDMNKYSEKIFKNGNIINPVISRLSTEQTKLFFSACHLYSNLETIKRIFKNSKVIQLTNFNNFLIKREYMDSTFPFTPNFYSARTKKYWDDISSENWHLPTSLEDFKSSDYYDEVRIEFPDLHFQITKSFELEKVNFELIGDYIWDCDDFFVEQRFLESIQNLYNYFSLGKINEYYITEFYRAWIQKNIN